MKLLLQVNNLIIYQGGSAPLIFIYKRFIKTILFLLLALNLASCSSDNEREVLIFNDITFKLNGSEEVIAIDSNKKEIYNSVMDGRAIQIPLFRCIKGDNYLMFLGIPYNTSIKQLATDNPNHTSKHSFFESDSTTYFYLRQRNENGNITEYSKVFDKNLVYILTVSDSVELSDSLFNRAMLSKRFNQ